MGLSSEYQALARWFATSGGGNFPAYLSAHFPHLYSDYRLNFSSGSSRFLAALSSAPPPLAPVSSASPPVSSIRPSAPLFAAPVSLSSFSSFAGSAASSSLGLSLPPVAPVSSQSQLPPHPVAPVSLPPSDPSALPFPFGASRLLSGAPGLPQGASLPGVPDCSGVARSSAVPRRPSAPPLFRPFALVSDLFRSSSALFFIFSALFFLFFCL